MVSRGAGCVDTKRPSNVCCDFWAGSAQKSHIRATAEAYSLTKIESAKPWLEAKFPRTHENAAPGGGPGTQEAPSRSGEAQQDVENLLRAQAPEIGGLRTRIGTLEGLVHNLKARIELLEASDGSDDDEHSERYSRHGATGGNMPRGSGNHEACQSDAEKYAGLYRLIQLSHTISSKRGEVEGLGFAGDLLLPSPPYCGGESHLELLELILSFTWTEGELGAFERSLNAALVVIKAKSPWSFA